MTFVIIQSFLLKKFNICTLLLDKFLNTYIFFESSVLEAIVLSRSYKQVNV